jgi:predicted amidohydrolase YtcJ
MLESPISSAAWCLALAAALSGCGSAEAVPPADLVLRGGRVVTLDDARPEGEAIAIRGYSIAAVGSEREIDPYVGPGTEVIELEGRLVLPGFIEGHGHYMGLGRAKMILDLRAAASWREIVLRVGEAASAARPGDWIFGSGWHQEKWQERPRPSVDGVPLHDALSERSPDNPVSLGHASGHAIFANARALALAGIDADTPDPPGGTIVRDAQGRPIIANRMSFSSTAERSQILLWSSSEMYLMSEKSNFPLDRFLLVTNG